MLASAVELEWYLVRKPFQRNVGLSAMKFPQRRCGSVDPGRPCRGGGEHTVAADKIAALPDRFARNPHCIFVITADELRVGDDAK